MIDSNPLIRIRGGILMDLVELVLTIIGGILIFLGGLFDLIAALGVNKFPDLYTRLHAVTIGAIGGAVYPIIGSAIIVAGLPDLGVNVKVSYILPMLLIALLILVTAPTGSHAIARAAYRSGLKPLVKQNRRGGTK